MKKIYLFTILSFLLPHISLGQETTLELQSNFHGYGEIKALDVENNRLYAVAGDYLLVYDISTPENYSLLGERFYSSNNVTMPTQIKTQGNYLYSNNGSWGILIFDVSNPASIIQKSRHYPSITNTAQGFSINDNIICMNQIIGYGGTSVLIGDISDPLSVIEKGEYNIPFYSESFSTAVKDNKLFIIAQKYYENSYLGADLIIVDISDLDNPVQTFRLHSGFRGLALQDNYLLTADTTNTLKIFDVSDVNNAVLVNEISFTTELPFPRTYFSTDNYHLITSDPFSGGYQKFRLYNSALITDIILNDSLTLAYGANYYEPYIFGNELFLRRSFDLTIYNLTNQKFEFDKKIVIPPKFLAKDVLSDNQFAYLLGENSGLYVLDISNPKNPVQKAFKQLISNSYSAVYKMLKVGNYIFICGTVGLIIIDVSNPYNPFITGSIQKAGIAYDVSIKGNYAYLTSLDASYPSSNAFDGFDIIDISDKTNPHEIAFAFIGEETRAITIDTNYAYVLTEHTDSLYNYPTGLHIYDISIPNNPIELNSKNFSFLSNGITISGNYAYLATDKGLQIIDITDRINPVLAGSFGSNLNVKGVFFKADTVLLAADYAGLYVVDVTDKTNPVQVANYNTSRTFGVNINGQNVFAASGYSGMYTLKLISRNNGNNDSSLIPIEFTVLQNFPNPFNNGTKIRYYMPKSGPIQIDLFDILGNKVAVLVNSIKPEGWHTLSFHPKELSSGVYLLRTESTYPTIVKKILYLK